MTRAKSQKLHQPVMVKEVLAGLKVQPHRWYIDATFGRGGHTQALLEQKARVIALDCDQEAIAYGREQFQTALDQQRLILIRTNFNKLETVISTLKQDSKPKLDLDNIAGILFDFGTTLDQLKSSQRGFSFEQADSELDMRLDQRLAVTAADLLNALSAQQLSKIFVRYGGESHGKARAVAQKIKALPDKISKVGQLTDIVDQVKQRRGKLHPATKIFQALRIAVNTELDNNQQGLSAALTVLQAPARVVTLAFHEGEDRIAKQQFKKWEKQGKGKIITNHPRTPSAAEIEVNPAASSAKLRIFAYETSTR
jgi:16S rRNA (cytosine1402-N4)-methyltransferase